MSKREAEAEATEEDIAKEKAEAEEAMRKRAAEAAEALKKNKAVGKKAEHQRIQRKKQKQK